VNTSSRLLKNDFGVRRLVAALQIRAPFLVFQQPARSAPVRKYPTPFTITIFIVLLLIASGVALIMKYAPYTLRLVVVGS
jgi:hypothetical protein